jgi:enamine deaminase RidA (YjgF/YER057c/UK114 family)
MTSPSNLRVDYLSRHELMRRPEAWWHTVLGVASFGPMPAPPDLLDIPVAPVGLRELGAAAASCEVWQLSDVVSSGRTGLVHYRGGEHVLFGSVVVPEPEAAASTDSTATAIQHATSLAYAEVFAALDRLGYRHLLRIWNYLSEINRETPHGERYRQFNSARRRAFLGGCRSVDGIVPAACALGSERGAPLVIYFLASRTPARPIENPRQVSAFRYPPAYGPDSPTFSRAALAMQPAGQLLLISGTASIVGHQTVHAGDAAAQTRESIANISAVVAAANEVSGTGVYSINALQFKVYVRRAEDLAAIRRELASQLTPDHPILYLQADICRSDLLVEIEAVGLPVAAEGPPRS